MAVWRAIIAFAAAVALSPSIASSQTADEAINSFRRGCLDQLPGFGDSKEIFERLGFVERNGRLRRPDYPGLGLIADVSISGINSAAICSVTAGLPPESELRPALAAEVAEVTGDSFWRKDFDEGNIRRSEFSWHDGDLGILVGSMQQSNGSVIIMALVAEVSE